MKTVYCPIKDDQINGIDCLTMCDVADNMLKSSVLYDGEPEESVLPKSIKWDEEQRQKCLNCQYHYDVDENKSNLRDDNNLYKNNKTAL